MTRTIRKENRDHERMCRAFFEQDAVGCARFAAGTGRFEEVNQRFCAITGFSREEMKEQTFTELAHPDDRAVLCEKLRELLSREAPFFSVEARFCRKDSAAARVRLTVSPLSEAGDAPSSVVAVVEDITALGRTETEQKNLEAQLLQAQKMEAIGQLAGGIAHDFNNILTAIIGYAEIVTMRMEKGNPLRHYVEQIFTSAERAADLTNSLLAFSRKQPLHTKPIDLRLVVRGLKKMLGRLIPEDIEFRTRLSDEELVVLADKGRIEQVIMNLVTNARDAMPKGGILTIEVLPAIMEHGFVHAHGIGEPGNYACIAVVDTGHGMDAEVRERIFEPFFTTKEAGKGTGLGMAIIYGIVQEHNGCIEVVSEPGRGSTFRVYLPLIAEENQQTHDGGTGSQAVGGTETILLVEDDPTVRELHGMLLQEAGYRLIAAADGEDALEKFMDHTADVDILVTDVIMPKADGKKLYECIRKVRPEMRVLFMSGYTRDFVLERGILEGEFNFMTKPVIPSELLGKVREILDRDKAH